MSNPIKEYAKLRNSTLASLRNVQLPPGELLPLPLPVGTGAESDIEIEVALPTEAPLFIGMQLLASRSARLATGRAALLTLNFSKPAANGTRQGNVTLTVPRMATVAGAAGVHTAPLVLRAVEKTVDVRILVDRSIVEVFAAGGRAVIATRDYPEKEETAMRLWSEDGRMLLPRVDVWSMDCGWAA